MSEIWFTSDWHFCHDKDFVWKARGFLSVEEMNEAIIQRHNFLVKDDDTVYCLGDLIMGEDREAGLRYLNRLKGKLYIVAGNHDSSAKIFDYATKVPSIQNVTFCERITYNKKTLLLSHYPMITGNYDDLEKPFKAVRNLHGHTHQTTKFTKGFPLMYHVGVDSNDCYPVNIDDVMVQMRENFEHI